MPNNNQQDGRLPPAYFESSIFQEDDFQRERLFHSKKNFLSLDSISFEHFLNFCKKTLNLGGKKDTLKK